MSKRYAAVMLAVVLVSGCFDRPRYGAGLAWQWFTPNNEDLEAASQVDIVGRLRCEKWTLDLTYGKRVVNYTNDDGGAFAGEIEFKPLGLAWRYFLNDLEEPMRVMLGAGAMALTGVEQRIAGVTGIDAGSLFKLIAGVEYSPNMRLIFTLEADYEFNVDDMTLVKPSYNGVNLDGTIIRLGVTYLF